MLNMNKAFKKQQAGSMLIEALISVLIFSMGILALIGLQGAMVKNASDAKYRADATFIAQQRIADMKLDALNAANYSETDEDISNLLPSGLRTTVIGPRRFATVTVTWAAPGTGNDPNVADGKHQFQTSSFIEAAN